MKRILFSLIFLGLFMSLYAENISINECQTDIYYGNGIMTTKDEARKALNKTLKPAILHEIYHGDKAKMKKMHHFDVAYNWSAKEKFGDTAIAKALDLMESYEQLGNTSWGWWTVQNLLSFAIGKVDLLANTSAAMVSKALKKYWIPDAVADFLADKYC